MNKNIIGTLIAVVVVGAVWYVLGSSDTSPSVSPSPSVSVSMRPSVTPKPTVSKTPSPTPLGTATPTPSPTSTPSPTPGIIIHETQVFTVTMGNLAFMPASVTVKQGDVIVFKNTDSTTHTVTDLNHVFDSHNLRPGDQWTLATADLTPGTYQYRCTLHTSMQGTIIVQ